MHGNETCKQSLPSKKFTSSRSRQRKEHICSTYVPKKAKALPQHFYARTKLIVLDLELIKLPVVKAKSSDPNCNNSKNEDGNNDTDTKEGRSNILQNIFNFMTRSSLSDLDGFAAVDSTEILSDYQKKSDGMNEPATRVSLFQQFYQRDNEPEKTKANQVSQGSNLAKELDASSSLKNIISEPKEKIVQKLDPNNESLQKTDQLESEVLSNKDCATSADFKQNVGAESAGEISTSHDLPVTRPKIDERNFQLFDTPVTDVEKTLSDKQDKVVYLNPSFFSNFSKSKRKNKRLLPSERFPIGAKSDAKYNETIEKPMSAMFLSGKDLFSSDFQRKLKGSDNFGIYLGDSQKTELLRDTIERKSNTSVPPKELMRTENVSDLLFVDAEKPNEIIATHSDKVDSCAEKVEKTKAFTKKATSPDKTNLSIKIIGTKAKSPIRASPARTESPNGTRSEITTTSPIRNKIQIKNSPTLRQDEPIEQKNTEHDQWLMKNENQQMLDVEDEREVVHILNSKFFSNFKHNKTQTQKDKNMKPKSYHISNTKTPTKSVSFKQYILSLGTRHVQEFEDALESTKQALLPTINPEKQLESSNDNIGQDLVHPPPQNETRRIEVAEMPSPSREIGTAHDLENGGAESGVKSRDDPSSPLKTFQKKIETGPNNDSSSQMIAIMTSGEGEKRKKTDELKPLNLGVISKKDSFQPKSTPSIERDKLACGGQQGLNEKSKKIQSFPDETKPSEEPIVNIMLDDSAKKTKIDIPMLENVLDSAKQELRTHLGGNAKQLKALDDAVNQLKDELSCDPTLVFTVEELNILQNYSLQPNINELSTPDLTLWSGGADKKLEKTMQRLASLSTEKPEDECLISLCTQSKAGIAIDQNLFGISKPISWDCHRKPNLRQNMPLKKDTEAKVDTLDALNAQKSVPPSNEPTMLSDLDDIYGSVVLCRANERGKKTKSIAKSLPAKSKNTYLQLLNKMNCNTFENMSNGELHSADNIQSHDVQRSKLSTPTVQVSQEDIKPTLLSLLNNSADVVQVENAPTELSIILTESERIGHIIGTDASHTETNTSISDISRDITESESFPGRVVACALENFASVENKLEAVASEQQEGDEENPFKELFSKIDAENDSLSTPCSLSKTTPNQYFSRATYKQLPVSKRSHKIQSKQRVLGKRVFSNHTAKPIAFLEFLNSSDRNQSESLSLTVTPSKYRLYERDTHINETIDIHTGDELSLSLRSPLVGDDIESEKCNPNGLFVGLMDDDSCHTYLGDGRYQEPDRSNTVNRMDRILNYQISPIPKTANNTEPSKSSATFPLSNESPRLQNENSNTQLKVIETVRLPPKSTKIQITNNSTSLKINNPATLHIDPPKPQNINDSTPTEVTKSAILPTACPKLEIKNNKTIPEASTIIMEESKCENLKITNNASPLKDKSSSPLLKHSCCPKKKINPACTSRVETETDNSSSTDHADMSGAVPEDDPVARIIHRHTSHLDFACLPESKINATVNCAFVDDDWENLFSDTALSNKETINDTNDEDGDFNFQNGNRPNDKFAHFGDVSPVLKMGGNGNNRALVSLYNDKISRRKPGSFLSTTRGNLGLRLYLENENVTQANEREKRLSNIAQREMAYKTVPPIPSSIQRKRKTSVTYVDGVQSMSQGSNSVVRKQGQLSPVVTESQFQFHIPGRPLVKLETKSRTPSRQDEQSLKMERNYLSMKQASKTETKKQHAMRAARTETLLKKVQEVTKTIRERSDCRNADHPQHATKSQKNVFSGVRCPQMDSIIKQQVMSVQEASPQSKNPDLLPNADDIKDGTHGAKRDKPLTFKVSSITREGCESVASKEPKGVVIKHDTLDNDQVTEKKQSKITDLKKAICDYLIAWKKKNDECYTFIKGPVDVPETVLDQETSVEVEAQVSPIEPTESGRETDTPIANSDGRHSPPVTVVSCSEDVADPPCFLEPSMCFPEVIQRALAVQPQKLNMKENGPGPLTAEKSALIPCMLSPNDDAVSSQSQVKLADTSVAMMNVTNDIHLPTFTEPCLEEADIHSPTTVLSLHNQQTLAPSPSAEHIVEKVSTVCIDDLLNSQTKSTKPTVLDSVDPCSDPTQTNEKILSANMDKTGSAQSVTMPITQGEKLADLLSIDQESPNNKSDEGGRVTPYISEDKTQVVDVPSSTEELVPCQLNDQSSYNLLVKDNKFYRKGEKIIQSLVKEDVEIQSVSHVAPTKSYSMPNNALEKTDLQLSGDQQGSSVARDGLEHEKSVFSDHPMDVCSESSETSSASFHEKSLHERYSEFLQQQTESLNEELDNKIIEDMEIVGARHGKQNGESALPTNRKLEKENPHAIWWRSFYGSRDKSPNQTDNPFKAQSDETAIAMLGKKFKTSKPLKMVNRMKRSENPTQGHCFSWIKSFQKKRIGGDVKLPGTISGKTSDKNISLNRVGSELSHSNSLSLKASKTSESDISNSISNRKKEASNSSLAKTKTMSKNEPMKIIQREIRMALALEDEIVRKVESGSSFGEPPTLEICKLCY